MNAFIARTRLSGAVLAVAVLLTAGCGADAPNENTQSSIPTEETAVTIEETGEIVRAIGDEVTALVPAAQIIDTARRGDRAAPVAGSDNDPSGVYQSWDLSIDFVMVPGTAIATAADEIAARLREQGWSDTEAPIAGDEGREIRLLHPTAGDYRVRILTGPDGSETPLIRVAVFGPVVDTERNVLAE